jgi:hypothetical protein
MRAGTEPTEGPEETAADSARRENVMFGPVLPTLVSSRNAAGLESGNWCEAYSASLVVAWA